MAVTPLDKLKKYVHATEFSDDDDMLQDILDASEAYVVRATQRSVDDLLGMGEGKLPAQLTLAILALAASRYNMVEGESTQSVSEVPFGVTAMIRQFRKLADPVVKEEGGQ